MVGKRPSCRIVRYWCWSIVPSIRIEIPTPWAVMQPHIISDPPPNFTVSLIWRGLRVLFSGIQHQLRPSEPNLLIFVSSDHITLFQSSVVQFSCLLAKASRSLRFFLDNMGFFFFSAALSPPPRRTLLTVLSLTSTFEFFFKRFLDVYCRFALLRLNGLYTKTLVLQGKFWRTTFFLIIQHMAHGFSNSSDL